MTGTSIRATFAWSLLVALIASPARGDRPATHEAMVAKCIREAAQGHKWLEITLWGLRDQEGGWAGAAVRNPNGSTDLGPLQINSWWIPRLAALTKTDEADVRRRLSEDICFNIEAGRWIFLTALAATNGYWAAVGAYHSPVPTRQKRYASQVAQKQMRRFGPAIFRLSPTSRPVATMETLK